MGVTQSDLRGKEVRSATLEECVGRTAGFVGAGRAREAFLCVQSYARTAWAAGAADAAERERRAAVVLGNTDPVVFMRLAPCVRAADAAALGGALDDLRLDVCTALDAAVRQRARAPPPAALLYLCGTAAALGVAETAAAAATDAAPCCALAPVCFTRYLDAALAANVQAALVAAGGATVAVLRQHFDCVEGLLAAAQRLVPPGTAYAALLAPVLAALVAQAQAETRALLQALADGSALAALAAAADADADALDAPRAEHELGDTCAAVMQCRLHDRCTAAVLRAYADADSAAHRAWAALVALVGEPQGAVVEEVATDEVAKQPEQQDKDKEQQQVGAAHDEIPTASLDEFLGRPAGQDTLGGALEHPVPSAGLFPDSYVTLALSGAFDEPPADDVDTVVAVAAPKKDEEKEEHEQEKKEEEEEEEGEVVSTEQRQEACRREIDVLLKMLVNMYMGLEDRYTAHCVARLLAAHTEMPAGSGPVPLVDEVFFVLTNALERAASTMDTSCFAAVATAVNDKIGHDIADRVRLWLRQWEEGATARRIDSFIAINNALGSVVKNTATLRDHALARVKDLFANVPQLRDVVACIDDFQRTANVCFPPSSPPSSIFSRSHPCPQQLRAILQENISRLSKTVVSVLQPQIEVFRRTDYCLTEVCSQHSTAQHDGTEIHVQLLAHVHRRSFSSVKSTTRTCCSSSARSRRHSPRSLFVKANPLPTPTSEDLSRVLLQQNEMTPENGEMLVDLAAQEVLKDLEAVVYEKAFTQYGGLQFSKEVQYLADFCGTHTRVPIHGRFARIRQVAQVLSLDKVCVPHAQHRHTHQTAIHVFGGERGKQPEDVLEFMRNEKVAWKLSAEDTRALLRRRKDFSPAAVQALCLPAQGEDSA